MSKTTTSPFDRIAMGLSGGGYRATAFHLGILDFLNGIDYKDHALLQSVKLMSTVSGGTFTGIVYADFICRSKSFNEVYDHLYFVLNSLDLINEASEKLQSDESWQNPFKTRNLINACAEIYDQKITQGQTLKNILEGISETHLDEVIFNTTEFVDGNAFRFKTKSKFGIKGFSYSEFKEELKLGDIMAASSCFPGGFEPMKFPHDFQHTQSIKLNNSSFISNDKSIALLDGGIIDNQGIDSLLNYFDSKKIKKKDQASLFMICDVGSAEVKDFQFSENTLGADFSNHSIHSINNKIVRGYGSLQRGLSLLMIFCLICFFLTGIKNSFLTGVLIATLSFTGLIKLCLSKYWKKANRQKQRIEQKASSFVGEAYVQHLRRSGILNSRISSLVNPILDRAQSLALMTHTIFMKRIRSLSYDKLYDPKKFEFKRISINIKSLNTTSAYNINNISSEIRDCPEIFKKQRKAVLSGALNDVEDAANFATKLWFSEEDYDEKMLDKLIRSGKVHACYFIIKYILRYKEKGTQSGYYNLSETDRDAMEHILDQCLEKWNILVSNS